MTTITVDARQLNPLTFKAMTYQAVFATLEAVEAYRERSCVDMSLDEAESLTKAMTPWMMCFGVDPLFRNRWNRVADVMRKNGCPYHPKYEKS